MNERMNEICLVFYNHIDVYVHAISKAFSKSWFHSFSFMLAMAVEPIPYNITWVRGRISPRQDTGLSRGTMYTLTYLFLEKSRNWRTLRNRTWWWGKHAKLHADDDPSSGLKLWSSNTTRCATSPPGIKIDWFIFIHFRFWFMYSGIPLLISSLELNLITFHSLYKWPKTVGYLPN